MAQKQHTNFGYKLLAIVIVVVALAQVFSASGHEDPLFTPEPPQPDDTTKTKQDTLRFPIRDRKQIDPQDNTRPSGIDLKDPPNIKKSVEYDPEENRYYLNEQVGERDIKSPTYMDPQEYLRDRGRQDETDYWKQRLDALSMFNQKPALPAMSKEGVFDRLFGSNKISVKPQGNLDLSVGGSWQNMKNPNLPQRAQKYGIFDFDMNMNVNVLAQIGDKLKLNISNNTLPSFGEQNIQKLEYTGKEDEIIKKIEAGTISFPLNSSLLSGPLGLFGLKAQLQFGKLMVTGVVSQQKSQRRSINLQGGAQTQTFEIKADDYEENRNFLLGQFFYDTYERSLENFPVINTQVNLTAVQVWITNRTGVTQGVRPTLALMDLGEKNSYIPNLVDPAAGNLPDNRANRLYEMLLRSPGTRNQSTASNSVRAMGLQEGRDFQTATMRMLNASEFTFQPQLGYIALNTQVNPDDVLAVAYRYTYNGQIYQVGEFAEDMPPDTSNVKVMYLKLLKGVAASPTLPLWKLMMKNVYNIGSGGVTEENFRLNVMYQDPGGGEKRYLPDGPNAGIPLLTLLNLDRLNPQNDPMPDGVFDFVEGITVNAQQGKIIFPKLEPFGSALKPALGGDARLERRYLYQILYDSTKSIARQFQQTNRFLIKGSYRGYSGSGSEISLGGFNIPEGSVSVTAGGQRLSEGVDYQVNYSRGSVTILNQGILNSGIPISISFEENANFGMVNQSFMGARFDYYASEKLSIGSTIMRLTERPFTQKVTFGDDPIKNTVLGFDVNYQNEFPWLTRALDKLPIFSTAAPSLISFSGEVAGIFPGHQRFINALDPEGSVYLDDFEGANSSIDLRFPITGWSLASTPVGAKDGNNTPLFPEATNNTDLSSGKNRARLAWYMIDPQLVDGSFGTPDNIKSDTSLQDYWRIVQVQDVFPDRPKITVQNALSTLDLTYFPYERGPYNFDDVNVVTAGPEAGRLTRPESRWAGIQKAIDNNSSDFEASNVEYITFWVLDPFIYNTTSSGGDLYINLGNVSEDVLKDSRISFENGVPYPKALDKLVVSPWGYTPQFQQQITRSFDNDPNARQVQDVGYDELDDDEERGRFDAFLNRMEALLGTGSPTLQKLQNDPASDNFKHFRNQEHDQGRRPGEAIWRYKDFNGPHGNSPVSELTAEYTSSGSTIPESEDINRDNSLNETEAYFQYRVRIQPNMNVGQNHIVDKRQTLVTLGSGRKQEETWYQFKIPIRSYDHAVGGINDFRSIRFVRLFMSGFQDSVVMRFAQLQLDRSQWRRYLYSLSKPGENIPEEEQQNTSFALTTVSLEENSKRQPVPYMMPPGVERQVTVGALTNQNLQQDEKSLALQVCGLKDGDARAAFKDMRTDMRQYKSLRMFIHAESVPNQMPLRNGDLVAFARIGSDFTNNYYEYQIPLTITPPGGNFSSTTIWPEQNQLDILFSKLVEVKNERNNLGHPSYLPYRTKDDKGNNIIIVGNPNFGDVKNIMLGVSNPKKTLDDPSDDGQDKCVELWFDELRMAGLDEKPGYAASGHTNIQLADLGNVHLGASMHTIGYGNIDQKVDERFRDNLYTYDASSNINLGKLLPRSFGLQLPVYVGYSQSASNPQYDPYDKDVIIRDRLRSAISNSQRDSLRKAAQDFASITSFNMSNVRYMGNPEKQAKAPMPWSLKNFDLNYSYNRAFKRNPLLERDEMIEQRLGLGYNYTVKVNYIEPFKKIVKSKSKWLAPVKDFNFNLLPSSFSFRNDLHRLFGETAVRNIDEGPYEIPSTFYKNFVWDRTYNLRWELTKSLSFSYVGNNQSRIDEPYGIIDSKEKRDTILNNLSRFGRNTYFSQSLNATYALPTQKIPLLDWTRLTGTYTSTYNWTAASRLAYEQGNIIANTQLKQVNGEFNFAQLYNKSRWLKAINTPRKPDRDAKFKGALSVQDNSNLVKGGMSGISSGKDDQKQEAETADDRSKRRKELAEERRKRSQVPPRPQKKEVKKSDIKGADTMTAGAYNMAYKKLKKEERKKFRKALAAWRAKKRNILPEISNELWVAGKLGTMLKRVTVNYSETGGTVLPGYMDSSRFLGVNTRSNYQWYDFAFGYQPGQEWLDEQAALQRISRDSIFNGVLQQTYVQNFNLMATLEPFPDMRLDLTWNKQFSKNYSETFKYSADSGAYQHYSPYSMGTFSITYIGLKTMFKASDGKTMSEPYQDFLNNRNILSRRLGVVNPYTNSLPDPDDPEYTKGYTRYAQDVLIPSFLAAYGGRDPNTVPLVNTGDNANIRSNPFKYYLPMPNWRFTYNGLSKIPALKAIFNNVAISHNYTGTLSMNSFVSSFFYNDFLGVGFPSFIDSNSQNYVPFYQVPNITITENLGPLAGVDIAFKSGLSLSLKYNKMRMLSLSLVDYQVSETKSSEFVLGGGHRLKGLTLPFTVFGTNTLKNDINIRMDIGYRNDVTFNSYLVDNTIMPTRGQKVITIAPSIDYIVNENLQLRFFYDRRQTIPVMSNAYPITNTRAGVTLRFLFAPQ